MIGDRAIGSATQRAEKIASVHVEPEAAVRTLYFVVVGGGGDDVVVKCAISIAIPNPKINKPAISKTNSDNSQAFFLKKSNARF